MFDTSSKNITSNNQAQLLVNGKIYGGWLNFSIIRSLEAPSGSFSLNISDRWPGQSSPWPIEPGDECRLILGGESLVEGYVDEVAYSLSGQSRDLSISGRDKSADLVDCSYVDQPGQWLNAQAADIAEALAQPFKVTVKFEGEGGIVKNFKVEPGESVYEALNRLCKLKGFLVWPDGNGNLIIGPAGGKDSGITIEESGCVSLTVTHSLIDRYSDYIVKGQRPTIEDGKDASGAKQSAQVKDKARDPGVKRYRPLMLISEGAGADVRERALWEAAVRGRAGPGS